MKKTTIITLALVLSFFAMNAQETSKELNNGPSFGFQLNQYQKDFGFGLNMTSPFFANKSIAIRLRGNLMFNEKYKVLKQLGLRTQMYRWVLLVLVVKWAKIFDCMAKVVF